jgi:hypothetical protein
MKKDKESILASMQQHLPAITDDVSVENGGIIDSSITKDTESDYEYSRQRLKKLIDNAEESIATMMALATDSEHPRAFEVLSNMLKMAADLNQQLMNLQKDRKKLHEKPVIKSSSSSGVSTNTTNNSIFVGTTTELQKFLTSQKAVVDI